MEVVHHADCGVVFPTLRHMFLVLFYYTLLQSLAKGTTTLIERKKTITCTYTGLIPFSTILIVR